MSSTWQHPNEVNLQAAGLYVNAKHVLGAHACGCCAKQDVKHRGHSTDFCSQSYTILLLILLGLCKPKAQPAAAQKLHKSCSTCGNMLALLQIILANYKLISPLLLQSCAKGTELYWPSVSSALQALAHLLSRT
eukprot:8293-Heterococcus_DN1.PRE.4